MHKLFLLLFFAFVYIPENKKPLYEKCLKPVVLLKSTESPNTGTGFIVRSQPAINKTYANTIITCAHVCEENLIVKVPVYKDWAVIAYKEYPTHKILVDHDTDLAILLFFSDFQMPTSELDLASENSMDDDVFIIGCGLSENPRLSKGVISGFSPTLDAIKTSISCVPGDSGSPLYKNNKAIGVCLGIKKFNGQIITDISIFRSLNEIINLLDKKLQFLINKDDKSVHKLFYIELLESKFP